MATHTHFLRNRDYPRRIKTSSHATEHMEYIPKANGGSKALLGEILHDTAIPAPAAARRYIEKKGYTEGLNEKPK